MTDEHRRVERLKRELRRMTNDELEEYLEAEPTERPRKERILLIEILAEVLGGGRRVQDRAWARC
jgi:hypothetical protein